jgi:hypothetical protein
MLRTTLIMSACLGLMGCEFLSHVNDDPRRKVPVLKPTAHAEILADTIHIGEKEIFDCLVSTRDLDGVSTDLRLTGPEGVDKQPPSWDPSIAWNDRWPEGTYKLTVTALGKVLAEREFQVRMIPRGSGAKEAIVVTGPELNTYNMPNGWTHMLYAASVVMPRHTVEGVWVKDHQVVAAATREVRVPPLSSMASLGRMISIGFKSKEQGPGSTLYVFVNGEGLYGAWTWADATQGEVVMPTAAPDKKDVALARAAAREASKKLRAEDETVGHALDAEEPQACALALDPEARYAYSMYRRALAENQTSDTAASNALNRARLDPNLTSEQRARLLKKSRDESYLAQGSAEMIEPDKAKFKRLAKKYRKGCLAEIGVPVPREPLRDPR